jgi:hypothetical protein
VNSTPSFLQPGNSCKRSRLPGWLRLVIVFAVLFALKYAMPLTPIGPAVQVVILLLVATWFAWLFWWNCTPDRRGVAVLLLSLWIAGAIKLYRM